MNSFDWSSFLLGAAIALSIGVAGVGFLAFFGSTMTMNRRSGRH